MARIIGFHRGESSDVIMTETADKFIIARGTEFKGKGLPTITESVTVHTFPEARRAFQRLAKNA